MYIYTYGLLKHLIYCLQHIKDAPARTIHGAPRQNFLLWANPVTHDPCSANDLRPISENIEIKSLKYWAHGLFDPKTSTTYKKPQHAIIAICVCFTELQLTIS